jgi:hypothetical protein
MTILFRRTALFAAALAFMGTEAISNPAAWRHEWPDTDFSRNSVDFAEIVSGGPPKDGIPALTEVTFIPVGRETRIEDREPVITLELEGDTPRAYPVRYLMFHEIANDTVAGMPVAVTYCPLCNSGMVFDRRVDGRVLTFGVSGKLRKSDMVMYDRETQSWWQQAKGKGIVGRHTGTELRQLPAWMESWAEFKARNPQGSVMDEPHWRRQYGQNPYVNYDSSRRPFLYNGEMPPHGINPLARVVRVGERAWPFERLRRGGEVSETGVRISWASGQASALDDTRIGRGRDVGTVRVRDAQGRDVPHDVLFAFAFHAFWPDGRWMLGD